VDVDEDAIFGGVITQVICEQIVKSLRAKYGDGIIPEEAVEQLLASLHNGALGEIADSVSTALHRGTPRLVGDLRSGDAHIARYLSSIWGPADNVYRAATFLAYEIGSEMAATSGHESSCIGTILDLHARACRTSEEVRTLAMNGLLTGAMARQRSLHELAVVASVIDEGGDAIATRYQAYEMVERWKDVQAYQRATERLGYTPLDDDEIAASETAYNDVIAMFGSEMRRENGWAVPMFTEVVKRNNGRLYFTDLERCAKLDHLRPFYMRGSHHVHAGPRAAVLSMAVVDGRPVRIPGKTVYGNMADTCHSALISMLQITSSLVVAWYRYSDHSDYESLVGLLCLQRLVEDAGDLFATASMKAEEQGLTASP